MDVITALNLRPGQTFQVHEFLFVCGRKSIQFEQMRNEQAFEH